MNKINKSSIITHSFILSIKPISPIIFGMRDKLSVSKTVKVEILIEPQVSLMPQHDDQGFRDLFNPINDQIHYISKRPTKLVKKLNTYFFPIGCLLGLRSTLLN